MSTTLASFKDEGLLEVGVDEAGRGPLMGRVYAAAVMWPPGFTPTVLINDSKKLKPHQLKTAYDYIKEHAVAYGIAYATEEEIESLNILHATMTAMHRAVEQCALTPDQILVDGNYFDICFNMEGDPIDYCTVEQGDAKFLSIAAASILAKWERDQYILDLCDQYPELDERYNIRSNKGYGAQAHTAGIQKYGISQFHRKTFKSSKDAALNPVKPKAD